MTQLTDAIAILKQARADLATAEVARREAYTIMMASPEQAMLKQAQIEVQKSVTYLEAVAKDKESKDAVLACEIAEELVKKAAAANFENTGNKHPHPAIQVNERTRMITTDALAFGKWALENQPLIVDIKPKKTPVGALLRANASIPGVKLEPYVQVTLKSDVDL